MIKKHRLFTLLEILISLGLATILLSALLYFYRFITTVDAAIQKTEIESFASRALHARLNRLFLTTIGRKNEKDQVVFYTTDPNLSLFRIGSPTLIFRTDNGANLAEASAGIVVNRLFVDTSGRLILATWSSPERWIDTNPPPIHYEVLAEQVSGVYFLFYVTQDVVNEQFPELIQGRWLQSWLRDYGAIPAMVKVILTIQGKDTAEVLTFPLIDKGKIVRYEL
ncbi:MAG: type II secretion system protein [Chlamydiia bacterium]|nr:type II secretion system protein [Chlamydiia bacterium]